jgi:hypothetical protein
VSHWSDAPPDRVISRLVAEAATLAGGKHPCHVLGHRWKFIGASNCGCSDGNCSVPVYECDVCGDCDYGQSREADNIRIECQWATA